MPRPRGTRSHEPRPDTVGRSLDQSNKRHPQVDRHCRSDRHRSDRVGQIGIVLTDTVGQIGIVVADTVLTDSAGQMGIVLTASIGKIGIVLTDAAGQIGTVLTDSVSQIDACVPRCPRGVSMGLRTTRPGMSMPTRVESSSPV